MARANLADAYAVKRSLGRCWGFSVLSFGGWCYWWFYVHRKLFDGELGTGRDDAALHTVGMFVPILNFFVVYWLWRDLNVLRSRAGLAQFPAVGYVIGSIFLAPLFYSLVVGPLNEYWDVRLGGFAAEAPATTVEKVLVAIGIGLWTLWLVGIGVAIVVAILAGSSS